MLLQWKSLGHIYSLASDLHFFGCVPVGSADPSARPISPPIPNPWKLLWRLLLYSMLWYLQYYSNGSAHPWWAHLQVPMLQHDGTAPRCTPNCMKLYQFFLKLLLALARKINVTHSFLFIKLWRQWTCVLSEHLDYLHVVIHLLRTAS
jgi:hypothetical protein